MRSLLSGSLPQKVLQVEEVDRIRKSACAEDCRIVIAVNESLTTLFLGSSLCCRRDIQLLASVKSNVDLLVIFDGIFGPRRFKPGESAKNVLE